MLRLHVGPIAQVLLEVADGTRDQLDEWSHQSGEGRGSLMIRTGR